MLHVVVVSFAPLADRTRLLDADAGGVVELEEFFLGCLRFGGNATWPMAQKYSDGC